MANERDVKLRISTDVDSDGDVRELVNDLDKLGNESKESAVEARALATELLRLDKQAKLQQEFRDTAKAVRDTSVSMQAQKAKIRELAQAYETAPTKKLETELKKARAEVTKTSTALEKQRSSLKLTSSALADTGQATGTLGTKQKATREALAKTKLEVDKLKTSTSQLGKTAREPISDPFGKLGNTAKTSAADIRQLERQLKSSQGELRRNIAEVTRLRQAYRAASTDTLRAELKKAEAQLDKTSLKVNKLKRDFNSLPASTDRSNKSVAALGRSIGALAGAAAFAKVGRDMFDAALAAEKQARAFTAITGSAEEAERVQDAIAASAKRMGLEVRGSIDAFVGLAAATKGTALEGEPAQEIFEAVSGAMAVLGKSSADTGGALQAISQIVSKGVVSMEELRQQLGERLPGAFQVAAKAMGVTTAELNDLVATGNLTADEFLPRFAKELKKTFGEPVAEGPIAELNAFKNLVNDIYVTLADNGALDVFTSALSGVSTGVKFVAIELGTAFERVEQLGKGFANIAAFLTGQLSFQEFVDNFKDAFAEAEADIQKLTDKLNGVEPAADKAAAGVAKVATESEKAAAAATKAAAAVKKGQDDAAKSFKALGLSVGSLGGVVDKTTAKIADGLTELAKNTEVTAEQLKTAIKETINFDDLDALQQFEVQILDAFAVLDISAKRAYEVFELINERAELLRKPGAVLVESFDKVLKKTNSVDAAVASLFKSIPDTPDGVANLLAALTDLKKRSDDVGIAIDNGVGGALEKVSTIALLDFEQNARLAFESGKSSAEELAFALEKVNNARLTKLGVDVDAIATGLNAAERNAVSLFSAVVSNSQNSGKVLTQSLGGALQAIGSEKGLLAIKAQLKDLAGTGRLTGKDLTAANKLIADAQSGLNFKIESGVESVEEFTRHYKRGLGEVRTEIAATAKEADQLNSTLKAARIGADGNRSATAGAFVTHADAIARAAAVSPEAEDAIRKLLDAQISGLQVGGLLGFEQYRLQLKEREDLVDRFRAEKLAKDVAAEKEAAREAANESRRQASATQTKAATIQQTNIALPPLKIEILLDGKKLAEHLLTESTIRQHIEPVLAENARRSR